MTTERSYLDLLPAVFVPEDERAREALKRFLGIFETVLTSSGTVEGGPRASIGTEIELLPSYFHPATTPGDFLDWLSSWVGLVLKEDWEEEKKRKVIGKIIPLYRMRGTKTGLEEFLNVYTNGGVTINDDVGLFQVGITSQVGVSTAIDLTSYFIVEVRLSESEQTREAISSKKVLIETIVDREKPVHTRYKIIWTNIRSLQVEVHSTVEVDTLVWSNQ